MSGRGARGQATVEFALLISLVLVVLLAVVQVVVVAYTQLQVQHLAREVARSLAVDPSADVGHLVRELAALGTDGLVIEVHFGEATTPGRTTVTVNVSYRSEPLIGLFSTFSDQLVVRSEVKMLVET